MDFLYKNDLAISYSASYTIDNITYFSNNTFNGLFSYNHLNEEVKYIASFPGESFFSKCIHQKAFFSENKIIFVPFHSGKLSIFDIRDCSIETVVINDSAYAFCIDAYLDNENLWLFFNHYDHSIFCVDIKDYSVIYDIPVKDIVKEVSDALQYRIFYTPFSADGDRLYGAVWGTNCILRIDIKQFKWDLLTLNYEDIKLTSIAMVGRTLYYSLFNSLDVYKYDIDTKETYIYKNCISNSTDDEVSYPFFYHTKDALLLISGNGNEVFMIKDTEDNISVFGNIPNCYDISLNDDRRKLRRFFQFSVEAGKVVLLPYSMAIKLIIDTTTGIVEAKSIYWDRNFVEKIYMAGLRGEIEKNKGKIILESQDFSFTEFIRTLSEE